MTALPRPQAGIHEVRAKVDALDLPFNRYGVDPFGVSRAHLYRVVRAFAWFYRHYFRVRAHGLANVPARGRAMLIGNHSGGVALDAAMIVTSLILDHQPPRLAHGMAEKFIANLPFAGEWASRCGQFPGLPEHAIRLLEDDRLLLVFPEGASGTAKLFPERHSLVKFGSGFMRLALATRSPIVPVAFLGGGEAIPTIHNAYGLGKLLGVPYVPLTPYGLALPLPIRLDVLYGAPMHFEGDGSEDDALILAHVERVKERITAMTQLGLAFRRGDVDLASVNAQLTEPQR
jgi:1-acyl-sn-glycerol-3-phosphate acyltransferase